MKFFKPVDPDVLVRDQISTLVNSPAHDTPEVLLPV
jgi:hypothetical protein